MPPVSQQGSRAGLITALVLSIVVAIVFIITTIYFNSQFQQQQARVDAQKAKYAAIVDDSKLAADGEFTPTNITELKKSLNVTGTAVVTDLLQQQTTRIRDAVLGSGSADSFDKVIEKVKDAVTKAGTDAPSAKVAAGDSVPSALGKLSQAVTTAEAAAKTADDGMKKKVTELTSVQSTLAGQLAKLKEQVDAADAKVAAAELAKTEAEKKYTDMQGQATDTTTKAKTDAEAKIAEAIAAKQQAEADRDKAQKDLVTWKAKIGQFRQDTKSHMITASHDGEIVRLGSGNVVYINLGSGDHLPPGLTFEVYDKVEGVPVAKSNQLSDSLLPVGKASIEVVRIGQNSSECRVVHTTSGQTVSQGDIIANLVYDRNTTYHFYVYGEFDVDQNGAFSVQEGEVIKSLITRWGGKVDDKIAIQTDFLILGREPKVPAFTQDELQDPLNIDKKNKAEAALKAYQDIIAQAADFHIPIMNQNRFLYYVGYYDQAKR